MCVYVRFSKLALSCTAIWCLYSGGLVSIEMFLYFRHGQCCTYLMLQCTVPHYVVRVTQSVRAGFVRDLIPVGMEFSAHPHRPCVSTQLTVQTVPGVSLGVKRGLGVLLATYPLLVRWSWKRIQLYLYTHRSGNEIFLSLCTSLQTILNYGRQHNACRYSNCH